MADGMYNSIVLTAVGRALALATAMLWLLPGCSTLPEIVGTYRGLRPYSLRSGVDPVVAKQAATVELTVKDDVAYLSDGGVPVVGHIDYGPHAATFVPDTMLGHAVAQQVDAVVQKSTVELKPLPGGAWLYGGTVRLDRLPTK